MKEIKSFIINYLMIYRYLNGFIKVYYFGKMKSKLNIFKELLKWLYKEKKINTMYYAFGLNINGSDQDQYIGKKEIFWYKQKVENKLKKDAYNNLNYDVITKDKFYANSILSANGLNCIKNIAVVHNSQLIFEEGRIQSLKIIFNFNFPFFIKNTILEASEGILNCVVKNQKIEVNGSLLNYDELKNKLSNNIWVIQKKYKSHEEIRRVNKSALNTTRIVTILNGKEPVYLTGFQSFATGKEVIDSWSKGSLYVGIVPHKNCLKKYGYYNPWVKNRSIVEKHPDSGIIFGGYKISDLKKAVDLCIKAHRIFYFNFIIGWDIAITDIGPSILEINERPGMNAVQCIDGGLRYKIKNYALNYLSRNK